MSIEFKVAADQKIKLTDLRHETEVVLRELLNLTFTPTLTIEGGRNGQWLIGESGDSVTFEVPDQGEAALMYMDLPHNDESVVGTERAAVIDASGWRTETSVALALALAIALARRVGKSLIDDALLFSAEACVAPDILLAQVRLTGQHPDLGSGGCEER
jgi:hypothetical protein